MLTLCTVQAANGTASAAVDFSPVGYTNSANTGNSTTTSSARRRVGVGRWEWSLWVWELLGRCRSWYAFHRSDGIVAVDYSLAFGFVHILYYT